ncbi:hypothetical protein AB0L65_50750 [Nonomuraea sp. NPDC052116]|uniref:hypothetical protein n=1 Tax=Nonomuraea sp. NPDC052116 TaxID=3155665 RepID=UPI00344730DC
MRPVVAIYASPEGARAVERRYRELLERWPVPYEHVRLLPGTGHLLPAHTQEIMDFLETAHA